MKLIEINLSGTNESVKSLCEALSRRFLGCTLYRTIGYWSEEVYLFKKSYEWIKEEQGYGIKVLIEEDLDQVEKVISAARLRFWWAKYIFHFSASIRIGFI